MRKIMVVGLAVALLSACSNTTAVPNENSALLEVTNDTNAKIETIEVDVTQMQQYVSTQGGAYADGSALKKGETLDFELTEEEMDFTQPVEVDVTVQIDGKKTQVGTLSSLQLVKGETVQAEIVAAADGAMHVQVTEK